MKEYNKHDIINEWEILEWRCINPNTKNKQFKERKVFALIKCLRCNQTIRFIPIYNIDNTISQCCRKCNLLEKNTQNREVKINNKYGKLTVIGDAGYKTMSNGKKRHFSLVQCDCGSKPFEIMDNKMQSGNTSSCGCLISKGEFIIKDFLEKNNINYSKEYKFYNCFNPKTNTLLRFDFAIFDKDNKLFCLIEFDGRQHTYGPDTTYWNKSADTLEDIQERDNIKNEYCKSNNIKLIRINYNQKNCIENILNEELKGVILNENE